MVDLTRKVCMVLLTVCRVIILCLSSDHALCLSCLQCVVQRCVCLATMLHAGLVECVV